MWSHRGTTKYQDYILNCELRCSAKVMLRCELFIVLKPDVKGCQQTSAAWDWDRYFYALRTGKNTRFGERLFFYLLEGLSYPISPTLTGDISSWWPWRTGTTRKPTERRRRSRARDLIGCGNGTRKRWLRRRAVPVLSGPATNRVSCHLRVAVPSILIEWITKTVLFGKGGGWISNPMLSWFCWV